MSNLFILQANSKYLRCIAVASFYLAAKTLEEDNVLPSTRELMRESKCGCSVDEIHRMEKCILTKLNWDLRAVTALDFLYIVSKSSKIYLTFSITNPCNVL